MDHLLQVEKQLGRKPKELEELPEMPAEFLQLHSIFHMMCLQRTAGMTGADPVSLVELQAYLQMTGRTLSPRELDVFMLIDRTFVETING